MSEEKKIIVDEDWKSQVASEKEQLAQDKGAAKPQGGADADLDLGGAAAAADQGVGGEAMPPASFGILISSLAAEAMMAMGQLPHPMTNELVADRAQARFSIDMLEMLQEKTKGNLDAEEESALRDLLHQLRMAFITV